MKISPQHLSTFDQQLLASAALTDLSEARVQWFLQQREAKRGVRMPALNFPEVLATLGAAREHEGQLLPTCGGMLFFGRDPQAWLPHSQIRVARFQGTTTTHFVDRADLNGTLPEMIEAAEQFVRRNTRTAAKVVGFRRREVAEYPFEAIREAICNAVCHRDYQLAGAEIRIMIFSDRLEINSPGGLPLGVNLANLARTHVLRNPVLANFLYASFYIEKWGTGIARMKSLMSEHGLAEPKFEDLGDFFAVTFYGPGDRILELVPEAGVTDLQAMGLNERQAAALSKMINHGEAFTNMSYRELFHVSKNTATRDLQALLATDWVKTTGVGKGTSYGAK
ncbi:MAG: ATP-binding protein [candidate division KSB1 bacterium]